ncbi:UDP-N-acetylmuramoyl-tripeptide--D-alanyl-D-alanine ligase [Sansalvadorimonas sp. 2012CJ34-2]|uniref:UDP-N-acetylmuramoyl-tripeptide--D-alanyl-D-alanine ligase n=1 Tax=Parendozoicomonas callyspongiae TaxID=2942213 RepID=A0ABT0PC60_9GAMM|nr:UDP-N-acetylmuramoyl-tripeptide--D-alanyl-D-alanine ligase [Sansalvadorimonas sp. 2012CJ34-2]MCL6268974.1 UDP-N-acetylmuramoyl-tripeptide--D-alanyl-D-alanine ligase [Sansalvadorimonas sp. 2012CJ34-2]
MIASKHLSGLADALSAKLIGDDAETGSVSINTRTLQPGQLFVAIKGPNFDGHRYVEAALEKGACGAVVSEKGGGLPRVLVQDTEDALTAIGRLNRDAFGGLVLGVTGSSGKTSVKEMLAAIFSQVGETLSTKGNLNNAYGVPVTLSGLTDDHKFAVVEMGTNSPGEIAHLTSIVRPHISMVNNAGGSHIAGLGGLAGVVQEKGAIFDRLPEDGCAIINLDDAHAEIWRERVAKNSGCRVATFSLKNQDATSRAEDIVTEDDGMHFTLHLDGKNTPVHLQFWGKHQVTNACAAAAVAYAAGIDIETIAAGLGEARPYARRGQRFRTGSGALIIDESYNANPESTQASIDELVDCDGYRILIVGDMSEEHFESEKDGIRLHRELGKYARKAGIDRVLTYGNWSSHLHTGFKGEGKHFTDKQELCDWLLPHLNPGVVVLVKGSFTAGMNQIVSACLADSAVDNSTETATEGN